MPFYRKYHGEHRWQEIKTNAIRSALENNFHNPSLCLLLMLTTTETVRTPFARYLHADEEPQPNH